MVALRHGGRVREARPVAGACRGMQRKVAGDADEDLCWCWVVLLSTPMVRWAVWKHWQKFSWSFWLQRRRYPRESFPSVGASSLCFPQSFSNRHMINFTKVMGLYLWKFWELGSRFRWRQDEGELTEQLDGTKLP